MKKSTITLIIGAIGVISAIAARIIENMDENVMMATITFIALPCLLIFNVFKHAEDKAKALDAKDLVKAPASYNYHERVEKEVLMTEPIIMKESVRKAETQNSLISV